MVRHCPEDVNGAFNEEYKPLVSQQIAKFLSFGFSHILNIATGLQEDTKRFSERLF
jgi:hypothetical protein